MKSEVELFGAQFDEDLPTLDLHGLPAKSAQEEIEMFVSQCVFRKEPRIRIIHGKGSGTLLQTTRNTLSALAEVRSFSASDAPHEIGGVTYAVLHTP